VGDEDETGVRALDDGASRLAVSVGRVFRQCRVVGKEDLGSDGGEDVREGPYIMSEQRNTAVASRTRSEFPTDGDRL